MNCSDASKVLQSIQSKSAPDGAVSSEDLSSLNSAGYITVIPSDQVADLQSAVTGLSAAQSNLDTLDAASNAAGNEVDAEENKLQDLEQTLRRTQDNAFE